MADQGHCLGFEIHISLHKYLMMLWLGVIVLLVGILLYLLFLPIDIVINTSIKQYMIRLGWLASARVEEDESHLIRLRVKALFTHFNLYPLEWSFKSKKKKEKKEKKKRNRKFGWSEIKTAYRFIRSFKLKAFSLDLDTGNCITNSKWYPVFALLSYRGLDCHINYINKNKLVLHIQNRPIRIIKSFINPKKLYHGITS